MKRTDTKQGRFYDAGGRKLPSVTTIIGVLAKPALIGWAAKEERKATIAASYAVCSEHLFVLGAELDAEQFAKDVEAMLGKERAHQKLMREAQTVGTAVHAWIEWQLKNELEVEGADEHQPPTDHPVVAECLSKWKEWRESVNLKPLAVEQRLASQDYGFAGTLDLLAEVDGKVVVIDFKTSKAIYAESFLQNCAYRLALSESGVSTEGGLIVRLPKEESDPTFEVREVPPMEDLIVPFLCLIPVFRWVQAEEKAYRAGRKVAA
jgi:hypothetical protein